MSARPLAYGLLSILLVLPYGCSSGGIGFTSNQPERPGSSDDNGAPADESPGATYGVIGDQGGAVMADDGSELTFAAGALSQSTRITVRDVDSPPSMPGYTSVGAVKRLEPDGLGFGASVTLRLTVDDLPAGSVVRVIAYDPSTGSWEEVPGARPSGSGVVAAIANLTVYAAAVREEGDPDGGRIVGVVTSGDEPLHEAQVEITDGPNAEIVGHTTFTGPAGGYELEGLPAGSYSLRATKDGYGERVALGVAVTEGQTTRSDFNLEADHPELGRIAGHVVNAAGHRLAEAKVAVQHGPGDTVGRYDYTNDDGIYELPELPAGTYTLKVTLEGYNEAVDDGIAVTAGGTTEKHFTLTESGGDHETGRIVGHVRNGEGEPLAEAKVEIVAGASEVGGHVYTDAEGSYVIEGLEPGSYALEASRSGYDPKTDDGIIVSAGETTEHNFALTAAEDGGDEPGSLRGVVRNQEGDAIAEATAEIINGPSRVGDSMFTNADGVFEFGELAPGTYALRVTHPSYSDVTEDGIAIEPGAQTNIEVTMAATGD